MKIYQPILFVGLGGTGCLIGAELERRLREEICGPDGSEFKTKLREDALRYELPSCLQFVYADVNQADLDRLPGRVVPGPQHEPAALLTAHFVRDLVPRVDTYPEVARNLRMTAHEVVEPWLPPAEGEPRVAPLQRGAGQLPTVGRAALFETFRTGIGPAVRELNRAIGNLSNSKSDLYKLSGGKSNANAVDVFVAFSVAGGTGAGIFYDYLHLIAELFEPTALRPKIYPLVLMPSAFPEGMGGGRPAELNSGRALLDLFRLVDQQNAGDAERHLRGHNDFQSDDERVEVRYPVDGRIVVRPGTIQTGFLFSRPVGAEPDDLRRSVVSLIMSLIGTELDQKRDNEGLQHQSFADSFINAQVERQNQADNGIGNRGVSTALVASMTVPVDDLADIVAGRLLRAAIDDLSSPIGAAESNRTLIREFFTVANISEIFDRQPAEFAEPPQADGAQAITATLRDRLDAMRAGLNELRARLDRNVPERVNRFDPRDAVLHLLARIDPFRMQRVLAGHPELPDEMDKIGAIGLMQRRRSAPNPPEGMHETAPQPPPLKDRMLGMSKVKWSDPEVVAARQEQEAWYRWRSHVLWTEPWSTLAPRWRRPLDSMEAGLGVLNSRLVEEARQDRDRFGERAEHLYRPRVGVSYLLPPGGDLEQFYTRVVRRMVDDLVTLGRLQPAAGNAELLGALIGAEGWREVYRRAYDEGPDKAISELRERIKGEVKTYFRHAGPGQAPLLPRLHDLLAQAAQQSDTKTGGLGGQHDDDLEDFRSKLAGLVPSNFTPQGTGTMKVLVSYPGTDNPAVAAYLQDTLKLPTGSGIIYEFRATTGESVTVVLFRSSMGITEVSEVRTVLRTWASAIDRPLPQDYLRWRQRTGYDFGYLATHEEHRVNILHRLLCAIWNGKVRADGDPASPIGIAVTLNGGVTMSLQLAPLERASSWASLLRAYELWTFADNADIRREFCKQLMMEAPDGVGLAPKAPSELYLTLCDLADGQIALLDRMMPDLHSTSLARARQLRGFWAKTLPAALNLEFTVPAVRANLRALEIATRATPDGFGNEDGTR